MHGLLSIVFAQSTAPTGELTEKEKKPSQYSGRFQDDVVHCLEAVRAVHVIFNNVGVNVHMCVNTIRQTSSVLCKYSEITGGAVCLLFWLREESNLPQLSTKYIGQVLLSYR